MKEKAFEYFSQFQNIECLLGCLVVDLPFVGNFFLFRHFKNCFFKQNFAKCARTKFFNFFPRPRELNSTKFCYKQSTRETSVVRRN